MMARTLLGLAHGAMSLGEWELAARWASQSQRTATMAKEGRVALEAEAVNDAALRRVQMNRATAAQEHPATTSLVDDFVGVLLRKPALAAV
jgi:hypothetical protein